MLFISTSLEIVARFAQNRRCADSRQMTTIAALSGEGCRSATGAELSQRMQGLRAIEQSNQLALMAGACLAEDAFEVGSRGFDGDAGLQRGFRQRAAGRKSSGHSGLGSGEVEDDADLVVEAIEVLGGQFPDHDD